MSHSSFKSAFERLIGLLLTGRFLVLLIPATTLFADTEAEIQSVINRMTLEEEQAMCYGNGALDGGSCARLGIGAIRMSDGPLGAHRAGAATGFGSGLLIAQTWNPELQYDVGVVLGKETNTSADMLLGPGMNIIRDLVCGRAFEYYTEDPYLNGKTSSKIIQGIQSQGVAACMKHFLCNNSEKNRENTISNVDDRTLREIYLPGYEMAIKEGGAMAGMSSCGLFNGVECYGTPVMRKILKDEYGFKGIMLTDWSSVNQGLTTEGAAMAGMDVSMPNAAKYANLANAVRNKTLKKSYLDDMVRRILRVSYFAGVSGWGPASPAGEKNTAGNQAIARTAAEEGIVLLKNTGNILPLNKSSVHTICLAGVNANVAHCGGGGSSGMPVPYEVTPLEGLQKYGGLTINTQTTQSGAIAAAATSDVTIIVTGRGHGPVETFPTADSEGGDAANMNFPTSEKDLINAVAAVSKKLIVVYIGGAMEMRDWIDHVPGVLYCAYPGMEGGNALAKILFGDVNPSGKLTFTWPKRDVDQPSYPTRNNTPIDYSEGVFVGYRGYEINQVVPEFAFGHGLSYATFQYGNLRISPEVFQDSATVTVSVDVKNTSARAGQETVQLYVADKESGIPRPVKELKGFNKVSLAPNQTTTVKFALDKRSFAAYWGAAGWYAEPGQFDILVGGASDRIELTGSVSLKPTPGTRPPPVPTPKPAPSPGSQAENAMLSGGASVASNHAGYSGSDFVTGNTAVGATTTFKMTSASSTFTNITLRYSNGTGSSQTLGIYVNGVRAAQTTLPATASWDTWKNKTESLLLNVGNNTISYKLDAADSGNVNLDYIEVGGSIRAPERTPYGGKKCAIPGTLEAENYDDGGEGVAFHDTTPGNYGRAYRSDDVDMEACTDTGGGFGLGWTEPGEWLEYSASVQQNATYKVEIRVARIDAGNSSLHLESSGGDLTGPMVVPSTGAAQNWTTITKTHVTLNIINNEIRLCCDGGGINVNWIRFTPE
ncbi:MAG: glycoside hydrolase family 3 C-terminal domain-containing protein [Luteolibacter sp.]|uniref:glycoside hydrolase family 3 C-terminal domain-containing protein n=1 Tax=Luteolibacter sp. TaxID=1962973 RepID=UPI003264F4F1